MESLQLDLFAHGRDVMLQNDVIRALHERDVARARQALAALAAEFPDSTILAPAGTLTDCLARPEMRFVDHEAAAGAIEAMYATVVPAAHAVFAGRDGGPWLYPVWLSMARAAGALAFNPKAPNAHAAFLLLQGGDTAGARAAVLEISAWRRIPVPLAWMIEACFYRDGVEAVWHWLLELAWIDAPAFSALVKRLDAPTLHRLLGDFSTAADDAGIDGCAWFPAWALITVPALAVVMGQTQTCNNRVPERTARLIADLLALEKQGRHAELVAKRKRLRDAHPGLYAIYMSSR